MKLVSIGDFHTEAGATLADAHIAYHRFGHLLGCLLYTSPSPRD